MSFIQNDIETEKYKNKTTPEELDAVLMLQFFIAWAGEGLTDPSRLGWWSTQLLDEWGGEDLFKRLFPRQEPLNGLCWKQCEKSLFK